MHLSLLKNTVPREFSVFIAKHALAIRCSSFWRRALPLWLVTLPPRAMAIAFSSPTWQKAAVSLLFEREMPLMRLQWTAKFCKSLCGLTKSTLCCCLAVEATPVLGFTSPDMCYIAHGRSSLGNKVARAGHKVVDVVIVVAA